MKRILITGVSGFVGSHLARMLTAEKAELHGTYLQHLPYGTACKKTWKLDILQRKDVGALLDSLRPAAVYHLAAQSIPRLSWQSPEHTFAANASGTLNILDAVRRTGHKCRILAVSTNLVYGGTFRVSPKVDESNSLLPENPYAASKAVMELACLSYASQFKIDVVIARPFNHLGIGQSPKLVFSDWCRQIARAEKGLQEPCLYVGNLNAYRDFLHVEDVVNAYKLLLKRGKSSQIYNVATGRTVQLQRYIDHLLRLARIKMQIIVEKSRLRTDDPEKISGDSGRLRRLGWTPHKTPFDALTEMLENWRAKISG